MAAKFTIAEVEEIVQVGDIKPEDVHVPGVYIKAIVKANEEKKIERLTLFKEAGTGNIKKQEKNNYKNK
jgi:acyl CoA:acetate/3-ketoacid CoA transferase